MGSGLLASPRMLSFKRVSGLTDTTGEDQAVICRFNKFIVEDYERELRLPSDLFENIPRKEIPSDVILISCLGMWAFELSKCSCHQEWVLSGDAWDEYTLRHLLRPADVIWFEQMGKMVFRTHVFDRESRCQKRLIRPDEGLKSRGAGAAKKRKVRVCSCEDVHQFTAEMNEQAVKDNHLRIPSSFVRQNAYVQTSKTAILVNSRGNAWEMDVVMNSNGGWQFRGWHTFFKSNKLEVGDACVFRLDAESHLETSTSLVMKVEIRK